MCNVLSLNISTEKISKYVFSILPCLHATLSKFSDILSDSNDHRCFYLKLDKSTARHKRQWFKNLVFARSSCPQKCIHFLWLL